MRKCSALNTIPDDGRTVFNWLRLSLTLQLLMLIWFYRVSCVRERKVWLFRIWRRYLILGTRTHSTFYKKERSSNNSSFDFPPPDNGLCYIHVYTLGGTVSSVKLGEVEKDEKHRVARAAVSLSVASLQLRLWWSLLAAVTTAAATIRTMTGPVDISVLRSRPDNHWKQHNWHTSRVTTAKKIRPSRHIFRQVHWGT